MISSFRLFLLIASFVFGIGLSIEKAIAQTNGIVTANQQNADDNEIVVTGRAEIKAAVSNYIKATLGRPRGGQFAGQYARFGSPICPGAYGFSESNNAQIAERIRRIAAVSEIPVGKPGCQTNIFVVAISDGKSAITELRKKHHRIFSALPVYRRRQLADLTGPLFGWKSIVPHSAEGRGSRIVSDGLSFTGIGQSLGSASSAINGEINFLRTNTQSLITKPVQQITQSAFLLLEEKELVGMTTIQIADFAAMYNLMETKGVVDAAVASDSILTLFDPEIEPDARPQSIGEWDLIMLSALYHSPLNVSAPLQRSAIQQRIVKEITQDN